MRRFLLACLILLLGALVILGWPADQTEEERGATQTITHPNGLALTFDERFSERYSVRQTQAGYILDLKGHSRSVGKIEVRLEDGPGPGVPKSPKWGTVIVESGANYWIEEADGGSGGTERELTVWQPCSDKHVLVTQHAQAEWPADFDFRGAIQIHRKARCPN